MNWKVAHAAKKVLAAQDVDMARLIDSVMIRPMEPKDLTPALKLIELNWDMGAVHLAQKEIIAALHGSKPQPVYYVAVSDNIVVGMIGICDSFMDTRLYEIFWVNVVPAWHGLGIGRMLVRRCLELALERDAALVLLACKISVAPFYTKLGFHIFSTNQSEHLVDQDYIMRAKPKAALDFIKTNL